MVHSCCCGFWEKQDVEWWEEGIKGGRAATKHNWWLMPSLPWKLVTKAFIYTFFWYFSISEWFATLHTTRTQLQCHKLLPMRNHERGQKYTFLPFPALKLQVGGLTMCVYKHPVHNLIRFCASWIHPCPQKCGNRFSNTSSIIFSNGRKEVLSFFWPSVAMHRRKAGLEVQIFTIIGNQ